MKRLSAILLLVSISGCTHTYPSMSQAERACGDWYKQGDEVSVTYLKDEVRYEIERLKLEAEKLDKLHERFERKYGENYPEEE